MPVKEDRVTTAFFKASTYFIVGHGSSARFWTDSWLDGRSIADIAPELAATVPSYRRNRRTVISALQHDAWISDITGTLTVPVIMQYLDARRRMENINLNPQANRTEVALRVWKHPPKRPYSSITISFLATLVIACCLSMATTPTPK
jgi:hypothetical protein